jgi:hypothetical protein
MNPEPPEYALIIEQYLAGQLPLAEAAQQLARALEAIGPVNLAITPQMRPLLAEVQRLRTGRALVALPHLEADPERHKDGNLQLLAGAKEWFWQTMGPDYGPTRLECSFHAASDDDAQRIARWLKSHDFSVTVRTPAEAGRDDWVVRGTTPRERWTPELLANWVRTLRSAPLEGGASIHGVGVCQN